MLLWLVIVVHYCLRFVIAVVHVVVVSYIVDYSYETLINYYYFIFVDFGNTKALSVPG